MPDTIETLIKRNLHEVFGERDVQKRRKAIAQLWTEDCVFIARSKDGGQALCLGR